MSSYPYVSPLPRVLAFYAQRLSNFSANVRQIVALGNEGVTPGDTVSFTLPENTLCDLRTLKLVCTGCTTSSTTTATNTNSTQQARQHQQHQQR
jgi:hypothetical protein